MTDQVFFSAGDVSVTSTLVSLEGGKTYATANITSVSTEVIEPPPRNIGCQVVLILVGALGVIGGFAAMGDSVGTGLLMLLIFGGLIAAGILWLQSLAPPLATYVLKIASAAGEVEGMRSTDRELIGSVSKAIMQAIAARG